MYVTAKMFSVFYITFNYLADDLIQSNFQMSINLSHKSQNTQSLKQKFLYTANFIVLFLIKIIFKVTSSVYSENHHVLVHLKII